MELNATPLRTSKSFNINNIELNIDIPKNIKMFKNIELNKEVKQLEKNIVFKYGVGLDYKFSNHKIEIDSKDSDNINLIYNFDDENLNLINQILINAYGNSSITIEYKSKTNKNCWHNGGIKLIVNENASVNVNIINFLNENSYNFETIESELHKNSKANYTIIDIGAKTSVSNYYSNIIEEKAKNNVKTIYLGDNTQVKDLNYIAELYGRKSYIDIDVQGALLGKAKKSFKGTINFKKGCKKSKGNENEYCMMLSKDAKAIALPMLLCSEDDVEGNHSTASGKVDDKVLFYIMTKGLNYKETIKLLVKSNFSKILDNINNEEIRNEIIDEIDKKLG